MKVIRIGLMAVGLAALLLVGLMFLLNREQGTITDIVPDKAQKLDLGDLESFLAYTIYNMNGQALQRELRVRGIEPERGSDPKSGYVVSVPELYVADVRIFDLWCHLADDETLRHAKFYIDIASESEVVDTLKKITSRSYYNKGAADVHVHQFWSQHMQVTGMSKGPKVYFEVSRR